MTTRIALLLLLLAASPAVIAQSADEKEDIKNAADLRDMSLARRSPDLESTILGHEEAVKFEAEKGDQKAVALISFGGTPKRGAHLKITAPVNKNAEQQELSNLQGLAGTAKLETGYNVLLSRRRQVRFDIDKATALCKRHGEDEGCNVLDFRSVEPNFVNEVTTIEGTTTALGAKLEYTRTKFDYLTADALAPMSDSHPQYAGSISYGLLPHFDVGRVRLYFAGVGYRYESSYEAAKKQQICKPVTEGSPALTCSEAAVGAPKHGNKRIAELRTRWFPSDDLGFDFVVYRNFEDDATGLELPIAFYRGKDGLFSGGVTLGWRSDKNEFTASVFVGAMRNLF